MIVNLAHSAHKEKKLRPEATLGGTRGVRIYIEVPQQYFLKTRKGKKYGKFYDLVKPSVRSAF